jgi:NCAIR mutase (PurE)-related protein
MTGDFKLDLARFERIGLDEAIFCAGKTAGQIAAILESFAAAEPASSKPGLLLTRLDAAKLERLPADWRARLDYDALSQSAIYGKPRGKRETPPVGIIMAGTSDLPMGREAARTLAFNGQASHEFTDIGVAGLWRLLERLDAIRRCPVLIVAAGMDAALISVVGGLVGSALIGLPTSVGYGVASGGTTALNSALASCAPGVPVVNIDNGYGAACAALRIMNQIHPPATRSIADGRRGVTADATPEDAFA